MKNFLYHPLTWLFALVIFGCSQDSEYYKTFVDGGEIPYTGKIDSVEVFSGLNRVRVHGIIDSDPKVEELRIYWNLRNDSVSVPVARNSGTNTISVMIDDLPENIYTFEFVTFDGKGNPSVSQSVTTEVYGERYTSTLFNRPLSGNDLTEDTLTVTFANMDRSTGVIGTEIAYTSTAGTEETTFVDIDDEQVVITNFESGSTYRYRTAFVPNATAIDTAYTAYQSVTPIAVPKLGNAEIPFVAAATDGGRWGNLAEPWKTNQAAQNHNGYGGWDGGCCGVPAPNFNIESGWGAPAVVDGKIYQSVDAPPATYELIVDVIDTNHSLDDEGGAYFVVTTSDTLPNVSDLATSPDVLNFSRINGVRLYVVQFTLEEMSNITVGQLTTQGDQGRFANIRSFELEIVD
ncbi:DUF4998 domain-containing protein [Lewinella sp. IMCC34183]|uniref:DUF4998 domain-containing protein n=1 Tax=Lewinella sp. IMCC34183 TaxID=2248762 RepID=UPI000E255AA6|nr:DUF4998 domain-containing protein [Lewinella sp. IMCC34183]